MEFEFFLERQNWGQLWGYSKVWIQTSSTGLPTGQAVRLQQFRNGVSPHRSTLISPYFGSYHWIRPVREQDSAWTAYTMTHWFPDAEWVPDPVAWQTIQIFWATSWAFKLQRTLQGLVSSFRQPRIKQCRALCCERKIKGIRLLLFVHPFIHCLSWPSDWPSMCRWRRKQR